MILLPFFTPGECIQVESTLHDNDPLPKKQKLSDEIENECDQSQIKETLSMILKLTKETHSIVSKEKKNKCINFKYYTT